MTEGLDLESDLMDAARMTRITVESLGKVLGFDEAEPPKFAVRPCDI